VELAVLLPLHFAFKNRLWRSSKKKKKKKTTLTQQTDRLLFAIHFEGLGFDSSPELRFEHRGQLGLRTQHHPQAIRHRITKTCVSSPPSTSFNFLPTITLSPWWCWATMMIIGSLSVLSIVGSCIVGIKRHSFYNKVQFGVQRAIQSTQL